jgi:hypothetical protein
MGKVIFIVAWIVVVACCAPFEYWAPFMALGLFSVGAVTEWPGLRWLVIFLCTASLVFAAWDLWRRGDVASIEFFALMLAAYVVIRIIRWRVASSRRGGQRPSPRTSEGAP